MNNGFVRSVYCSGNTRCLTNDEAIKLGRKMHGLEVELWMSNESIKRKNNHRTLILTCISRLTKGAAGLCKIRSSWAEQNEEIACQRSLPKLMTLIFSTSEPQWALSAKGGPLKPLLGGKENAGRVADLNILLFAISTPFNRYLLKVSHWPTPYMLSTIFRDGQLDHGI